MKKFVINDEIFKNIDNLSIGVLVCTNVDNKKTIDLSSKYSDISKLIVDKFSDVELCDYPVIRKWRDIYKSFGEKKNRSSIEALIRRIANGKELYTINPIVDIYNYISLKYEMPVGGEDLDVIDRDMELTYASGNEVFIPLGSEDKENPLEGEIIYKFGDNVICRSFNYRESDLTKITDDTKNVILVIENVVSDVDTLKEALRDLENLVKEYLGGDIRTEILDINNQEIIIKED